ncbi:MAG: hypothetical protein E7177_00690 [Erysipelotrichaceae bacterium]|nr:hypothetical protein [Erysipelotrichaceae bacterium]
MKKNIIKCLLILSTISFVSCDGVTSSNNLSSNEETNINEILYFKDDSNNKVVINEKCSFEVWVNERLYFYVEEENLEGIEKEIALSFNKETTDIIFSSTNDFKKEVCYTIYPKKVSENNVIELVYNEKVHSFTYDIVDYNFNNKEKKIESIEDLSSYPEFVETLNSIEYYSFKEPYVGLTSFGESSYWKEYILTTTFVSEDNEYSLDYLKYVTDSIYYPSKLDLVSENEVANRDVSMYFYDLNNVKEGAKKSTMEVFALSYGVIDPCCTNPTNPLYGYTYKVFSKIPTTDNELALKRHYQNLYNKYYQLSKIYPEQFFKLNIGDIEISIIEESKGSLLATFEDESYVYLISYYYNL